MKKEESTHQLAKELGIVDFGNETLLANDFKISNYPNVTTTGDNLIYNVHSRNTTTYNSNIEWRSIEDIVRNMASYARHERDELP